MTISEAINTNFPIQPWKPRLTPPPMIEQGSVHFNNTLRTRRRRTFSDVSVDDHSFVSQEPSRSNPEIPMAPREQMGESVAVPVPNSGSHCQSSRCQRSALARG